MSGFALNRQITKVHFRWFCLRCFHFKYTWEDKDDCCLVCNTCTVMFWGLWVMTPVFSVYSILTLEPRVGCYVNSMHLRSITIHLVCLKTMCITKQLLGLVMRCVTNHFVTNWSWLIPAGQVALCFVQGPVPHTSCMWLWLTWFGWCNTWLVMHFFGQQSARYLLRALSAFKRIQRKACVQHALQVHVNIHYICIISHVYFTWNDGKLHDEALIINL